MMRCFVACRLTRTYGVVNGNLTLDASSLYSRVTLLAPPYRRHFNITQTAWLTATKVTFSGGRIRSTAGAYGGSLYFAGGGSGLLSSCTFTNNTVTMPTGSAAAKGGGVYFTGPGRLLLRGCLFSGNKVGSDAVGGEAHGGGLCVEGARRLSLWQTVFIRNSAQVCINKHGTYYIAYA